MWVLWHGNTDSFDTVAGAFEEDTLAWFLFIICLDYILWTSVDQMKENGFTLKQKQEANDIRWKLLLIQTIQTILHFLQIQ